MRQTKGQCSTPAFSIFFLRKRDKVQFPEDCFSTRVFGRTSSIEQPLTRLPLWGVGGNKAKARFLSSPSPHLLKSILPSSNCHRLASSSIYKSYHRLTVPVKLSAAQEWNTASWLVLMDCGVEMQSLSVKCLFIQLTKLLRGALAEGSTSERLLEGQGGTELSACPSFPVHRPERAVAEPEAPTHPPPFLPGMNTSVWVFTRVSQWMFCFCCCFLFLTEVQLIYSVVLVLSIQQNDLIR